MALRAASAAAAPKRVMGAAAGPKYGLRVMAPDDGAGPKYGLRVMAPDDGGRNPAAFHTFAAAGLSQPPFREGLTGRFFGLPGLLLAGRRFR